MPRFSPEPPLAPNSATPVRVRGRVGDGGRVRGAQSEFEEPSRPHDEYGAPESGISFSSALAASPSGEALGAHPGEHLVGGVQLRASIDAAVAAPSPWILNQLLDLIRLRRLTRRVVNELLGKVAVVTGAASGLGRGIAQRFAAEGARVVIADVDTDGGEALAAALGPAAIFQRTDVSDPGQVGALVAATVAEFGDLHVMVNNAGVSGTLRRLLDDDLSDFHRVMAVNVLGVMAGTRDAARHMAEHGGGSVINLTSIGGIQAGGGVMTYRASKAAVIQFTKSAAIELAHYDIRVNAIAPGNIPTPILASSAGDLDPEELERFEARIRQGMRDDRPLKREGTPDDVAETALYFATDRSRYVTGTVLPVDGGTVAGKAIRPRNSRS